MMRAMLTALLFAMSTPLAAEQVNNWPIAAINRAIDSSNFIVGRGCSGTLINLEHRLVLTNSHCISANITSVEQEVTGRDGIVRKVKLRRYTDVNVSQNVQAGYVRVGASSYTAEIVAENRNRDLALLRLRGQIPHTYASHLLPEGDSILRGETVYIVGNPLGEDATLGRGVVSRLRRMVFPWANGAEVNVIQHDAGSTGGNSGGALYNARGQLIGVPAAGYPSAPQIGFAVSVEFVRAFLRESCWARAFDGLAGEARDAQCELARKKAAAARGRDE